MGESYKGQLAGREMRIGITVSRFNEDVTARLLNGALEGLSDHGVKAGDIDTAWVPGAMELPLAAKKMAATGQYSAIICLGAVIRGETAHFDYVSSGVTQAWSGPIWTPRSPSSSVSSRPRTGSKPGSGPA